MSRLSLFCSTLLTACLVRAGNTCVVVSGRHILAKDLAAANSFFAALDPAAEIGFSPRPGAERLMRIGELRAIARRYGIGEVPLRDVSPGTGDVCFVGASALRETAGEVERGEAVNVEVHSGAAHLKLQGRAESAGKTGESVMVRNPATGRAFVATVEANGKVVVRR